VQIDVVSPSTSTDDVVFPKLDQSDGQSWKKSFGSVKVPMANLKQVSSDGKLLNASDWRSSCGMKPDEYSSLIVRGRITSVDFVETHGVDFMREASSHYTV
jgi:hypothetical protein